MSKCSDPVHDLLRHPRSAGGQALDYPRARRSRSTAASAAYGRVRRASCTRSPRSSSPMATPAPPTTPMGRRPRTRYTITEGTPRPRRLAVGARRRAGARMRAAGKDPLRRQRHPRPTCRPTWPLARLGLSSRTRRTSPPPRAYLEGHDCVPRARRAEPAAEGASSPSSTSRSPRWVDWSNGQRVEAWPDDVTESIVRPEPRPRKGCAPPRASRRCSLGARLLRRSLRPVHTRACGANIR